MQQLPEDLQKRYEAWLDEYRDIQNAYIDHVTKNIPRYVSVPKYFEELGFKPTYLEMLQMAEMAQRMSKQSHTAIKQGFTSIGALNCYLEEVLDKCLDTITNGK